MKDAFNFRVFRAFRGQKCKQGNEELCVLHKIIIDNGILLYEPVLLRA